MRLYLAGPLFTTAERAFNLQLRDRLVSAGHEVWLPREKEPREKKAAAMFKMDVEGIDWADVVVANMDGSDPDSGTCWECGYAYRKKPVIVYRTDIRAGDDPSIGPYNLMLTESADLHIELPFKSIDEIVKSLTGALASLHQRVGRSISE
jgi:nucleoside 2-deoxyribosyltransferase